MDLSLRFISKRTVCAPERSYCDKSALSRNAAAACVLLKAGIFFFIGFDLLFVHVARADRPDQLLIILASQGEHKKYFPAIASLSHSAKAAFLSRISRAGNDGKRPGEQAFNQCSGKPVLLALGSVASIPVKALELQEHDNGLGAQMYRQMYLPYLCSKSTGAVTSCTRKYLASAGYFRATASYMA